MLYSQNKVKDTFSFHWRELGRKAIVFIFRISENVCFDPGAIWEMRLFLLWAISLSVCSQLVIPATSVKETRQKSVPECEWHCVGKWNRREVVISHQRQETIMHCVVRSFQYYKLYLLAYNWLFEVGGLKFNSKKLFKETTTHFSVSLSAHSKEETFHSINSFLDILCASACKESLSMPTLWGAFED